MPCPSLDESSMLMASALENDSSASSTYGKTGTTRIIQTQRLRVVRAIWVLIVLTSTSIGIVTLSIFTVNRMTPCLAEPCNAMQMSVDTVALYEGSGVPFAVIGILRPILEAIVAAVYMTVGVVIFRRRSDDWMGVLTSLMLCVLAFRLTGVAGTLPQLYPDLTILSLSLTSIMFMAAYSTLYLFPNGLFYSRWSIVLFVITLVYEILLRGVALYFPQLGLNASLMQFGAVILGAVGLIFQTKRYQKLSPTERQQVKWVILAVALLLAGLLVSAFHREVLPLMTGTAYVVFGLLGLVAQYLLFMGLPLAFAFSMLRYRLWDADLVINRALVYAGLTLTLVTTFFGLFFTLMALLAGVIGTDSTLPLVVSTAVAAALFNPARTWLARRVDRQIYGLRVELRDIRRQQPNETRFVPLREAKAGLHSGKRVGGYELGELLGKGGMGEVYAAREPRTERIVAVKVLPPELAQRAEPLGRFQREAEVLRQLDHPNVVHILGAGMADDLHYLVMELVDGDTLSERIKRGAGFSRAEAVALVGDVARALDAAHAAGIVHRDVKPSNILLRPTAEGVEGVLTDFGIAKLVSEQTGGLTESNLVGTLDYIAPEQIMASRSIDHRADIYALGVIAYQLLTGQHPFAGPPAAMLFAHLNQPPPDPCDLVRDLPRSMALALLKALAKKPEERFASAGEFALALEI